MPFLNFVNRSHPSMQCLAHSRHSLIRSSPPENFQFLHIFTSLQLERGKDFRAVSLSTLITEVIDFKPKGLHPEFLTKLRMRPLMTILTQVAKRATEYRRPQSQTQQAKRKPQDLTKPQNDFALGITLINTEEG